MSSIGFHEDASDLSDKTKDMHRAIVSLMEELEAIDWYNQRVDASKDSELKALLVHNRDEEKEHAAAGASQWGRWLQRQDLRVRWRRSAAAGRADPVPDRQQLGVRPGSRFVAGTGTHADSPPRRSRG